MKLLLVLGSDDNYEVVSGSVQALGFEVIRYRHVLKAMDNIDEVDPSAIIISARDFPRHWKILVQFVRNERSKEACPIIILKGTNFNTEETSKALFLGVNGIVSDTLANREDTDRLKNILGRSSPSHEEQKHRNFPVEPWHRIGFLVADFSGKSIVAANVKSISAVGLSFSPVPSLPPKAVKVDRELRECSLRTGDAILSPVCRITGMGKNITLEFVSFPANERQILNQYLEEFQTQESRIDAKQKAAVG
jgi:hypothetical protein